MPFDGVPDDGVPDDGVPDDGVPDGVAAEIGDVDDRADAAPDAAEFGEPGVGAVPARVVVFAVVPRVVAGVPAGGVARDGGAVLVWAVFVWAVLVWAALVGVPAGGVRRAAASASAVDIAPL